jgi:hypothetical protein
MDYKFKSVNLNLERDTIDVVVAFQVSRNQWQLKNYTFDAPDEIDIEELLERTRKVIFNEK